MPRLRTANMLAAFAREITERVGTAITRHPNQTDSASAALNIIGFWDGITNAQLARALKLSHTATVRLVDKLEGQSLVEARGGNDKRATHLHLTSAGRDAVLPMLAARCAAVERYLTVLAPDEERQLTALLEKLMQPLGTDAYSVCHFCRLCDLARCPADQCPMHAHEDTWPHV
jgi:MarR family transcriptional repressor of emrRAB